jgi:hypothetical protein
MGDGQKRPHRPAKDQNRQHRKQYPRQRRIPDRDHAVLFQRRGQPTEQFMDPIQSIILPSEFLSCSIALFPLTVQTSCRPGEKVQTFFTIAPSIFFFLFLYVLNFLLTFLKKSIKMLHCI